MTATAELLPELILKKLRMMPRHEFSRIVAEPTKHESQRELFRDTCSMTRAKIPHDEQDVVLRARFRNYYRPIADREFESAIRNASADASPPTPRWPKPCSDEVQAIVARYPGALDRLRQESPVKNPGEMPTGTVIDLLFEPHHLLCFGSSDHHAFTAPRGSFVGSESKYPLIVPNPMSAPAGMTKDGHPSPRTLSNVGPVIYCVIEFDNGDLTQQAAILLHLKSLGVPLRMVVFSGSKSLHGWFLFRAFPKEEIDKFLRYAAYVGADTATFSPIQFVRTPNAWRDDNRQQTVYFLS